MLSGGELLKRLRKELTALTVDALYIPTADAHNSEYVARSHQRRAFVSNFHGSAGSVLITADKALLWTDARYWLEAAASLYPEFALMKKGEGPPMEEWVKKNLGVGAKVGVDPFVISVGEWERLSRTIKLEPVRDIVEPLMRKDDSPRWKDAADVAELQIYRRPLEYSGKSCAEKRAALVEELKKENSDLMVLSALDEVAWLTNLRGRDVPYNPVFCAYALVRASDAKVQVFTNLEKVGPQLAQECQDEIDFLPYEDFPRLLEAAVRGGMSVLVDELQTSKAVYDILSRSGSTLNSVPCGPAQKHKAIKNPVELEGFRNCHVRDGAALTQYLAWLRQQIIVEGNTELTEFDAASKLELFRSSNDLFVQLSFASISCSGPNGAIMHYHPSADKSSPIRCGELYLIDSGAQYWDGTTDTTRTVCFDTPREEEREAYTRVLKGHIALSSTVFPKGTSGHQIDAIARTALWSVGLNYNHGTGHGVGSFLNVHEGPHGIGQVPVGTKANLEAGMIVSNEPGYYKDGGFGIRLENLEEIIEKPLKYSSNGFLGFSALTLVPFCRELIDPALLSDGERIWINDYHQRVRRKLLPLLEERKDTLAISYLEHHTKCIESDSHL